MDLLHLKNNWRIMLLSSWIVIVFYFWVMQFFPYLDQIIEFIF